MNRGSTVFYKNVISIVFLLNIGLLLSICSVIAVDADHATLPIAIKTTENSSVLSSHVQTSSDDGRLLLRFENNSCALDNFQVWIVVHGTYAKDALWYRQEGSFFEGLKANLPENASLYSFSWSGKLKHEKRLQAGKELAEFIEQHVPSYAKLCIVAHSYGSAVATVAAHELYEKKSENRIHQLFTLGSPISSYYYNPTMEKIDSLYNIFSFGDVIQPIFGLATRVYPTHAHIWNIEMKKDGLCPDHNDLHCPELAELLPFLPLLVKGNDTTIIHLKTDKNHIFEEDLERERALEIDKKNIENILKHSYEFVRKGHAKKYIKKATKVITKNVRKRINAKFK